MRSGLSLVEIILALVLLGLLTGVSLVGWGEQVDRAEITVCRGHLRQLVTLIDRWQVEQRRPWFVPRPPGGFPADPWGQAYRVDPARGLVWSRGPDRDDQAGQGGDDLVLAYQAFPAASVGMAAHVTVRPVGGTALAVSWTPPQGIEQTLGVRVSRREGSSDRWSAVATLSPSAPAEIVDPNVDPATTYFYRVEALPAPGATGPAPLPSAPAAGLLPASSNPGLTLVAEAHAAAVGSEIQLVARGSPGGAPLTQLTLAGTAYPVGPGPCTVVARVLLGSAGPQVLQAELLDEAGMSTVRTVEVEVY